MYPPAINESPLFYACPYGEAPVSLARREYFYLFAWASFLAAMRVLQLWDMSSELTWGVTAFFIVIVTWRWPAVGVATVLCLTIMGEDASPYGLTLNLLGRILLLPRLFVHIMTHQVSFRDIWKGTFQYWLPFAATVILSYLTYGSSTGADFIQKFLITIGFAAAAIAFTRNTRDLLVIQTSLVICAVLNGLWAIQGYLTTNYRSGGLAENVNYSAMYLSSILYLAYGLWEYHGRKANLMGLLSLVLIGGGILAAVSRGSILILAAGFFMYMLLSLSDSGSIRRLILGALVILFVGFGFVLNSRAAERLFGTYRNLLQGSIIDSESGKELDRLILWRDSVAIWRDNPILGVGPDNWYQARLLLQPSDRITHPIIYLGQLIAETGSLGLVTFSIFVLASFLKGINRCTKLRSKLKKLSVGWIAAGFAMVSSTFSGYAYNPYMYVLLILATSSSLILLKTDQSVGKPDHF